MRARRTLASTALLVALVLVLAACGSGNQYVTSKSTGTFLKVPEDWKVFERDEVLAQPGPLTGTAHKDDDFIARFDADPKPSLQHSFLDGDFPFGMVRVRSLGLEEHDAYSLATLRNEIIPVDQLLAQDPDSVLVLDEPELITKNGLRGSRLEYSVQIAGGLSFTVSQVGLVDTPTRQVWFLLVGCSTKCYQQHKSEIRRVVDSWTVEGK